GDNQTLTVQANVTAATPATDTDGNWTSILGGNDQAATTTIAAPALNISAVYCGADTDCNVTQRQAFTMNVTVDNINNATNSGDAIFTTANVTHGGLGIDQEDSIGNLSSGSSANATFSVNITEAGRFFLDTGVHDGLTATYTDTTKQMVDVTDIVPPNTTAANLEDEKVNVDDTATFTVTARDNLEVDTVLATVRNTSDMDANESLTLDAGDRVEGSWKLEYNKTDDTGFYNITQLHVNDTDSNTNTTALNESFEVTDLTVDAAVNTSATDVVDPVTISANVTGNTSSVDRISANITKPRGYLENVSLTGADGVTDFDAVYTNTSRSGDYTVNVTVNTGVRAWNASETFSTGFGDTGVTPLDGNTTDILLPEPQSPYNLSWQVDAVGGDLEDVNTTLAI
ncbi:MAG: hypothetical protein ABEI97_00485, partial [Candidatus Nanohaloarchaea archaeon]